MNTLTLGQVIGKVKHNLSITNDDKDKVQLGITIDFTNATNADCIGWLVANRIIAGQRPWRGLSKDELEALDGQTFMAVDIGRKVKSRQERIAVYTSMGLTEAFAIMAVDSPVKFQAMMKQVETTTESKLEAYDEDDDGALTLKAEYETDDDELTE